METNPLNIPVTNQNVMDWLTQGINPNSSIPPRTPQVIATQGGITAYPDKLSTVLSSILSGVAIIKGAQHVPTTVSQQPVNQGLDINTLALLQAQGNQSAGGGNFGAGVQNFIQNNTGAVLIIGIVVVAYLTKSPRK